MAKNIMVYFEHDGDIYGKQFSVSATDNLDDTIQTLLPRCATVCEIREM